MSVTLVTTSSSLSTLPHTYRESSYLSHIIPDIEDDGPRQKRHLVVTILETG